MKKTFVLFFACLSLLACNGNGTGSQVAEQLEDSISSEIAQKVFEGVMPAADCDGVKCTLTIPAEAPDLCKLTWTFLEEEATADSLFSTEDSYTYEVVEKDGSKYYCLNTPCDEPNIYFKIIDDSTLRMVNDSLEEAEQVEGMSYDLKLVKE